LIIESVGYLQDFGVNDTIVDPTDGIYYGGRVIFDDGSKAFIGLKSMTTAQTDPNAWTWLY
jgi:hypothetical protein